MNVTSLRRPANKPRRPAWRAPGPAKVPSWSARPPAQVVRRTTRTTVVQVDDAQLFAEEAPRAPPARVAAAPPPPPPAWSPGTPRAASPPPPPFVHQGVVEWSPPRPEDADDDIVWARPRPLPRPAPAPVLQASDRAVREQQPPRSPLERLESLAADGSDDSDDESASMPRDSDDASSAASPPARTLRDDAGPASPTTMEAVGLLVEHAARLEDEVRRRTGVLEDEVIRLRTEGAAQETAALRGELAELRAAILGAVRRDPEPHDEIERLRDEVAELRASARLPPEDLGDALAAVTRAAVDKVAAVRNQVADRHWVPEDAAAPTRVEQTSAEVSVAPAPDDGEAEEPTQIPDVAEKTRFSHAIYHITPEEMCVLVEKLDTMCPDAIDKTTKEEIEISIDMIDAHTFRELDRYVRECLAKKNSRLYGHLYGPKGTTANPLDMMQ